VKLNSIQLKKYLNQASSFLKNGYFEEAGSLYLKILNSYPAHPEALTMLATVYFNQHRLNEGINLIEKSIQTNPFQPEAFNNYAIALRELSKFDDALEKVQQAIKLNPNFYDAYYNQGLIYRSKGLLPEALQSYEKAIQINKNGFDSYLNISYILIELKNYTEALNVLHLASQMNPNISEIHYNAGLSYLGLDKIDNAIESFDIAIRISPNNYFYYYNQGLAYIKNELFEDALSCMDKALFIKLDYYDALNEKGLICQKLKRWEEAQRAYELAILSDNNNTDAFNNKASMHIEKKEFKLAIDLLYKSLELEANNAEALNNMAIVNQSLGEYKVAIEFYMKAIEKEPTNKGFKFNLALLYLVNSDFENGWPLYQNRSHLEELETKFSYLNRQYIKQRPQDSKPILVLSEQGIGDQILFLSLLFELLKFENKILVALDERLIPLFNRSFPSIHFYSDKSDLSSLDYSYNLLAGSMGKLFRKSTLDFERQSISYLKPNTELTKTIRASLKSDSKLICGIAWKSANKKIGHEKSLSLESYKPFFEIDNIDFIDLQYGDTFDEKEKVKSKFGVNIRSVEAIDKFNDIDGLAALVNACDFIITTSNVTAHIAGAIGKKTYLLVPFNQGRIWYWHDSIEKSLWYPSISIYRQTKGGDWMPAIIEIKKDIELNK
jgi:tetratricopeptide (TPR) repeat protein